MKGVFKSILVFVLLALLLSACGADIAPPPESDSGQNFNAGAKIPVDDNVYVLRGEIVGNISSLTEINAEGSAGMYGSNGFVYGQSSFSMWQEGKGFVRVKVKEVSPGTPLAKPGSVIIIKTTDKKLMAILPGDVVTVKCRAQYEAIAAVRDNETFNVNKLETWELDYCRMVTPLIN